MFRGDGDDVFGFGAVYHCVFERGLGVVVGCCDLVLGDVPNMAQALFDIGCGWKVDFGQVGRFCLDEYTAVGAAVQALGLHVSASRGTVSSVVIAEYV